jgi:hypothetical protein
VTACDSISDLDRNIGNLGVVSRTPKAPTGFIRSTSKLYNEFSNITFYIVTICSDLVHSTWIYGMKFINNMNKAPLLQHYVVLQFHVVIYKSEGGISLPKSEVIMNFKATHLALRGIWSTENIQRRLAWPLH